MAYKLGLKKHKNRKTKQTKNTEKKGTQNITEVLG